MDGGGLLIKDDNVDGWGQMREEEEDGAMVVESRAKAGFKPISRATVEPDDLPNADEAPFVVIVEEEDELPPTKSLIGGLQSAEQLSQENERRRKHEAKLRDKAKREIEAARVAGGDHHLADETVHRDASGKRIDTKAQRAEQVRQRRDEMEREMQKMEWGKGLVQREDKEKKRQEEEEMAAKPMARYADDFDLNAEQREVERWNDPAAAFLTKKKKVPNKPRYQGPPPPPNRFNILPGYRWDGVDRSNGFERKRMQVANERKMRKDEAHAWGVEDM